MADAREEGLIYLDGLIEKLRGRAEAVNSFWLKAIGKRIRELKNLDPSDAAGIAAIRNDTQLVADIVDMLRNAGQDTIEDAKNVLRAAARLSMEASPVAQDLAMEEWINGIAEATAGQLSNMANTSVVGVWTPSGFKTPREAYITAIDQAAAQMASGTMGLNTAVRSVLKQFADSGLAVVQYESGTTRSLGAAVEMNIREATSMVYQGVQRRIGQEYGADGVEISAHWDCAPDHLDVQGKQYSTEEFEKLQKSLARPIGTMNCRHTTYAIILGISPATYSDAELQAMKEASLKKKEFDGKEMTTYEATQVQRRLEREIRKQKNRTIIAKEAGDDEMRREAQMKINQLTGKYKDLSDTFSLPTKAERMAVSGYRPVKVTEKLPAPKPIQKQAADVIKSNPEIMVTIPAKTTSIDFEHGGFQNIGTMQDMRALYDISDPGREFAVSKPVLYNNYASDHLRSDPVHMARLAWIKSNESDLVRAIEHPEYIEKELRQRNDGYYSATHFVKVQNPTSHSNTFMAVAISLSKEKDGGYHQITTIYPKREKDIIRTDGSIKGKFKKL